MDKEYDITNVLEKIKSKDITYSDVNFNLIPEIILHYQNILVPEKKFGNPFKKNFKWELTTLVFKFLVIMKKHNHDNLEVVEYLIKKIKDEKNLDRNDFDNLLKEVKIFVKTYNERTDIVNELLENNFGNAEILTTIKKTISIQILFIFNFFNKIFNYFQIIMIMLFHDYQKFEY